MCVALFASIPRGHAAAAHPFIISHPFQTASPATPSIAHLPPLWNKNDDRRRVVDATDIVRLIGDHLTLKPKGREYVCLCPFHNDHSPSMYVVPAKQIYHCFVCGASGGAIDFVMKMHGMGYGEALRYLADRAGIELTPWKPSSPRRQGQEPTPDSGEVVISKDALVAANSFALEFFRTILRHSEHGIAARAVIEQRRISPEMVEQFKLGAAPDRWDGLVQTIEARGLDMSLFLAAGLVKKRESSSGASGGSGCYDALRNRVIFPILDQLGRPIAFGGRKIKPEDEPKYLNSPETALFNKSSTLFALPQAFRAIQNQRCAIVTEGYTDAIACHQAGIPNVVATLGTALTSRHAAALRRTCDKVVLLFDGDEAGQLAADRAIETFFAEPIDVFVMSLPGGKDPDEVLKHEGGKDVFDRQFAAAVPALQHRFARKLVALGPAGSAARARQIEEDLGRLVELGLDNVSPIRRQMVIRQYAQLAGVSEKTIEQSIPRAKSWRSAAASESAEPLTPQRREHRSPAELALACVLALPSLASTRSGDVKFAATEVCKAFPDPSGDNTASPGTPENRGGPIATIAHWLLDRIDLGEEISLSALLADVEDDEARQAAAEMSLAQERRAGGDEKIVSESFHTAILRLQQQRSAAAIASLSMQSNSPDASLAGPGPRSVTDLSRLLELRREQEANGVPAPIRIRPLHSAINPSSAST